MIFLTGATGYIGSHLLERFVAQRVPVRCLVLPGDARSPVGAGVEVVRGDVEHLGSFAPHGQGVEAIVHCAALMPPSPADRIRAVNLRGTANVIAFARQWGIRRLVYFSAVSAAYGEKNCYGRSKAEAEALLAGSGLAFTILRPTMVYGRGGGRHFMKLVGLLRSLPLLPIVGTGGALLQPVWIDDVVTAVERVLGEPRAIGRCYGVSGGTIVRFDQFADLILARVGRRLLKVRVPLWACKAAASVLTACTPATFFSPEAVLGLSQHAHLDHGPLREDCGYSPIAIEAGLDRALGATAPA